MSSVSPHEETHSYFLSSAMKSQDVSSRNDQDDDAEPDAEDDVLVKLDSGDEVPLSELKSGYLKDKDYRHKTTELAEERKQLAATQQTFAQRSQFVETTLSNLTTYLENLVPPEPPISLAQSDPGAYQYQKALRDNAIAELGQLVQMKDGLGQAQQGFSQEDVTRLKGEGRPVIPVEGRSRVLAGLGCVDWVVSFEEDTPEPLLSLLKPDVLVKGGDYAPEEVVGGDLVREFGGEVKVLSLVADVSTTAIVERIKENG